MAFFDMATKKTLETLAKSETVGTQRERIEFLKDQIEAAEKKISALETENLELLRENRDLTKSLDTFRADTNFIDLGICCVKKNPSGGFFETPFCVVCKKPMSIRSPNTWCDSCSISQRTTMIYDAIQRFLKEQSI